MAPDPLGESFEGDLKLKSTGAQRKALREPGTATLRLDGLRVTAFGDAALAPLAGTGDEPVTEPAPVVASQP